MGIKTMRNFMLILNLLKKMRKTCKQKNCRQNKGANLESVLFFATSCSFLEITVSGSTLLNLLRKDLGCSKFAIFPP